MTEKTYDALCLPDFDPNCAFRMEQKGLWRSDNFERFILSVAKKTKKPSLPGRIVGFDLPRDMIDGDIRKSLGDNHVFEADEGCFTIASMISRQSGGDGDLLTSGRANIFYIRGLAGGVFAVDVRWFATGREWRVGAGRLGVYPWGAGDRAFSRNRIFDK